jgi:MoxR-like ATPase
VTANGVWQIYRGQGEQHDGIDRLPPPPRWRSFDGDILTADQPDDAPVGPRPGTEDRARNYRPESAVADMANAAMLLRRPLLVTGRPGTGKSTLAFSIAWELKLGPVLYWSITSSSRLQPSLYRYDAVGRLHEANRRQVEVENPSATTMAPFISLGPLGTALVARSRPRVLLIDEFDKSDIDLPNDLLNVLEEGQFTIGELAREGATDEVRLTTEDGSGATVRGGQVRCNAFPIIIITSNGERELPEAFKRRCLRVTIPEPDPAKLAEIVRTQLGDEAFTRAEGLFNEYITHLAAGNTAPADQLLNAIFLASSGLSDDESLRERVARRLLNLSDSPSR